MEGCKTVAIPEELHARLRRECKECRPRVNLGDRIAILIERGLSCERDHAPVAAVAEMPKREGEG